jgi:hypothetical protein
MNKESKPTDLISIYESSLEEILIDFIDIFQSQLNNISKKNPNTLLISQQIFETNRDRLKSQIKQKISNINQLVREDLIQIDQDDFSIDRKLADQVEGVLKKFDRFYIDFKSKLNYKNIKTQKRECFERLTDFISDSESDAQIKNVSRKKCKHLFESLGNMTENCFISSDEDENENHYLTRSKSETELDNLIMRPSAAAATANTKQLYNKLTADISFLSSSTSTSTDYSMNEDINCSLSSLFENQNDLLESIQDCDLDCHKKRSLKETVIDEDCVLIEEGDSKISPKLGKLLDYMEKLENKNNIKYAKFSKPVFLGMRVLALKNPKKHKWKLGKVITIKDANSSISKTKNLRNEILSKKYRVCFDQNSDDSDCNDDHDDSLSFSDEDDSNNDECYSSSDNNSNNFNKSETKAKRKPLSTKSSNKRIKITSKNGKKATTTKNFSTYELLDSKSIAFLNNFDEIWPRLIYKSQNNYCYIFPIQSRVVTFLQLRINHTNKNSILYEEEYMCSGTVIEMSSEANLNRCLILFDNGLVQYTKPNLLYPIFDLYNYPLNRLSVDHVKFLNNYFKQYPDRNLLKMAVDQKINVYTNGKWILGRVVELDCSLVRIEFKNKIFAQIDKENEQRAGYTVNFHRGSFCLYFNYNDLNIKLGYSDSYQLSEFEKYYMEKREKKLNVDEVISDDLLSCLSSSVLPIKEPLNVQSKFYF